MKYFYSTALTTLLACALLMPVTPAMAQQAVGPSLAGIGDDQVGAASQPDGVAAAKSEFHNQRLRRHDGGQTQTQKAKQPKDRF